MKKLLLIAITLVISVTLFACKNASSENNNSTIVGMPNPWVELTAEGLMEKAGVEFVVPTEATEIVYRYLESEKLSEMQFTEGILDFNARIKPTNELEDITGLYYDNWYEEKIKIGRCNGKILQTKDGENTIEACLWYDPLVGLTYSISTQAKDLDGFDLTAIALQVYKQISQEA